MASQTKTTTNHDEIRRWAEERGGCPARVKGTGGGEDAGLIRIDFPGYTGQQSLERISWEEFFEKFEEKKLALIYRDETASGEPNHFNKLISRETAEERKAA